MDRAKKYILPTLVLCTLVGAVLYQKNKPAPVQHPGWDGYAKVHAQSPMLAMPGMSTRETKNAIGAFKKTSSLSVLPFSDDETVALHLRAYPMDFLSHIPDTEEARRNLLKEASASNAQAYHRALLSLIEAYDLDLARTVNLLSTGRPLNLRSFKGTTSSTYIAETLSQGRERLAQIRKEEARRYACAEGDFTSCSQRAVWSSAKKQTRARNVLPLKRSLPQTIKDAQTALSHYAEKSNKGLYGTATIALSASHCYASYTPTYYDVSFHTSAFSSTTAVYVTLLSDTFFYDLSKIPVSFSKALLSVGIPYSYQPFNVYICQDSGRELGDLLTLYNAREELREHPFAHEGTTYTPIVHNLLAAQDTFLESEIIYQEDYNTFIAQADMLIARATEAELLFFLGSKEAVNRLRDLSLEAKTRSARFEAVLGYFDDLQASTYTTAVFDPYRTNVFATLRSGISPLLLIANETGPFPKDTSLFYTVAEHEIAPTGFTLLSYQRDLQSAHTLEELLSMHIRAHNQVMQPLIDALIVRRGQM